MNNLLTYFWVFHWSDIKFLTDGKNCKKSPFFRICSRYGNPSRSTWQQETKTTVKNNIGNEMKTQTNKYHTFSFLLFNQLSLYMQCANILILDRFCNNFSKLWHFSLRGHTHSTKFPKSNPHKIVFIKITTALLTFRTVKISAR